MTENLSPTMGRWELGEELRRIRESLGKTIDDVSRDMSALHSMGFSASKISRLETARRGANPRDVRDLCEYYEIDTTERDRLVNLAKRARTDNSLQGVPEAYADFVALEAKARVLRNYEPMYVPGLLQTPDYYRACVDSYAPSRLEPDSNDDKYRALMQVRRERQRRLTGPDPLVLHAVIDENVTRRIVGSAAVTVAQLEHLVEISALENVSLKVVPASCGLYPGCESAGFTLIEYHAGEPTRDNICLVEGLVGAVWVERAADRTRVSSIFEYIDGIAYDVDRSREFIAAAARRLG